MNRGDVLTACVRDIQSQRSIRMAFVIIMILFDIVEFRENIHMTVNIFANVHQLMFFVLKLVWIHIEYSLV